MRLSLSSEYLNRCGKTRNQSRKSHLPQLRPQGVGFEPGLFSIKSLFAGPSPPFYPKTREEACKPIAIQDTWGLRCLHLVACSAHLIRGTLATTFSNGELLLVPSSTWKRKQSQNSFKITYSCKGQNRPFICLLLFFSVCFLFYLVGFYHF